MNESNETNAMPEPFPPQESKPKRPLKKAKPVELTEEQKTVVRAQWDKKEMIEVTREAFGDATIEITDARHKAVAAFIASLNPDNVPPPAPEYKPSKGPIILTDAQLTNITALLDVEGEKPSVREIVMILFPEMKNPSSLSAEYLAVLKAVRQFNENAVGIWEEPVEERRYRAPVKFGSIIGMVNRYVGNINDPSKALYDAAVMKTSQTRNLQAMWTYLQSDRFTLQASMYMLKADRALFESTFVRHTHDKATDLTAEDVDTYISIAAETVHMSQLGRDAMRQREYATSVLDGKDEDGSKAKLSMSLVESIKVITDEENKAKKQLKSLTESVQQSRAKRNESRTGRNEALINLIQLWEEEATRNNLAEIGMKEHEEDEKEMGKMRDADEAVARIMGMNFNEALGGI